MNLRRVLPMMLIVLIIPQFALAAWWNPLSWFESWSFLRGTDVTQMQVLEVRVDEPEVEPTPSAPAATVPVAIQEEKPVMPVMSNVVLPQQTVSMPQTIVDVCLNIEGIQTAPPASFSSVSNICTLIDVKDVCPNIAGTQATVPSGRFLYRNTGECLTEAEISATEVNVLESKSTRISIRELKCSDNRYLLPFSVDGPWAGGQISVTAVKVSPVGTSVNKINRFSLLHKSDIVANGGHFVGTAVDPKRIEFNLINGEYFYEKERYSYSISLYSEGPYYRSTRVSVQPYFPESSLVAKKTGEFHLLNCDED